ncbi:MAG: leucine-rich repeat protein [Clostridia bacterium]|nr:leucine-rich repeat protein [Clostridia bacterium]
MNTRMKMRLLSMGLALSLLPTLTACNLFGNRSNSDDPQEETQNIGDDNETLPPAQAPSDSSAPAQTDDPPGDYERYRLTLSNEDTVFGSVSGGGLYRADRRITVTATPSLVGYTLQGWYLNGRKVSDQAVYSFLMPEKATTLEARWKVRDELHDFTFTSTKDTCTVTGVSNRSATSLTVPDFVTDLGEGVFQNCSAIRSIHLPASITVIPKNTFRHCSSLEKLTADGAITEIGEDAFLGCGYNTYKGGIYLAGESDYEWLTSVPDLSVTECVIHPNTKYIASGAFRNHSNLRTVQFPAHCDVTVLGNFAFAGCTSLETIALPDGIKRISPHAFDGCTSLINLTVPQSVDIIDKRAFNQCTALSNVTFTGNVSQWNSVHIESGNSPLSDIAIHCRNGDALYAIHGYGRTLLNENETYIYDLLVKHVISDTPTASFDVDTSRRVTAKECKIAFETFILDFPECFWLDQVFSYHGPASNPNIVSEITPRYLFTGNALIQAKKQLNQAVKDILEDMPEEGYFEQTHYLHDAVANRVTYRAGNLDQTAYGALVKGEAVCAGYSAAYQLLLQSVGYKAWSINGISRNQEHRWNVVWLDHVTCVYTDVTWDDSMESQVLHRYFNLSLEEFSQTHQANDPSQLPPCDHTGFGYFEHPSQKHLLIDEEDSFEKLKPLLQKQANGTYSGRLYYTGNDFEQWIQQYLEQISEHCGFPSFSFEMTGKTKEILLTIRRA